MRKLDRRTTIKAIGATASLAGFSGLAAAQDENGGEDDESNDGDEPDYGDWFDDIDEYEETVDETDEDEVVIAVGAGDQGFRFDPPAVRISEGTTIVWEWTGDGGDHDVVHAPESEVDEGIVDEDDQRETEFEYDRENEAGHTIEQEFEEEGVYLYVCTPHRNVGMRGAIVVGEPEADDDEDETDD